MLYEAVGTMISASSDVQLQEQYISSLMEIPNEMVSKNRVNVALEITHLTISILQIKQSLSDTNASNSLKSMASMIKVNIMTCRPVGPVFRTQLQHLIPILVQCYANMSQQIQNNGPQEQLHLRIRQLILELLETFILSIDKLDIQDQTMLTSLITVILADYKNSTRPEKREPNVLGLLTCFFEKMQVTKCVKVLYMNLFAEIIYSGPHLARFTQRNNRCCICCYIANDYI